MIHPAVVYDSQEDHSLDLTHLLGADLSFLLFVELIEYSLDVISQLVLIESAYIIRIVELKSAPDKRRDLLKSVGYSLEIPLFRIS